MDRDPDAGVQAEGDPADPEGLVQRHAQLVGHRAGSLGGGAREQDGELVPAEPGDGVGFPQRPCEPLADLDEANSSRLGSPVSGSCKARRTSRRW
jgi:hypothetical protein